MTRRPSPIDYDDFRSFLADYYAHAKAHQRSFSYRAFSQRAGLKSPNHLQLVIKGKRSLTDEVASAFAQAMRLDTQETEYFCQLSRFNQAKTHSKKQAAYEALLQFRAHSKTQRLRKHHASYHSNWYTPTIREMSQSPRFQNSPSWIAKRLRPPIKVSEVKRAISTLKALGVWVDDGVAGVPLSTGPQTDGMHIQSFHKEMLERANEAVEQMPADEREFNSLTFCANEETFTMLKQKIREFSNEMLALIAERESEGTHVMQMSIMCFPLSESLES